MYKAKEEIKYIKRTFYPYVSHKSKIKQFDHLEEKYCSEE